MTSSTRAIALFAILAVADAAYAATAREMYGAALAKERQLRSLPESQVSLTAYRAVVAAFEAVVRKYPASGYADNALWEGAQVASAAAERFGRDRDRQAALRLLSLLTTDYASSRLRVGAAEELKRLTARAAAATKAEATSPKPRTEPPAAKADGIAPKPRTEPPAAKADGIAPKPRTEPPAAKADADDPPADAAGSPPLNVLRDVRRTVMGDVVRVTIELAEEAVYRSERIENPARVLFDLSSVRLGPAMPEGSLSYPGDIVRHIRVGRHPKQVVRVVIDLEGVKRFSVFTLYRPYRIVVDCERAAAAAPPLPTETILEESVKLPPPPPPDPPAPLDAHPIRAVRPTVPVAPAAGSPSRLGPRTDEERPRRPSVPVAPFSSPRGRSAAPPPPPLSLPLPLRATRSFAPRRGQGQFVLSPAIAAPVALVRPAAAPAPSLEAEPTPAKGADAPLRGANQPAVAERVASPTAPPAAEALRGNYSLARQLGLGAARIVIDPGHGGHDPGAEGVGRVFEATVVLDVAQRLERLLVASGSEAVLTRRTDVYVPLEERTAMANQARGDLFLSIHANASRNRKASGVESYVLNFATTPDAEAVAARENASTGRTMSSLTDMVRAITLNNKLNESRTFAALVQQQMVEHLKTSNQSLRDHGVKQAPFVVLIGASMPSVLVEISFITNSQEGRLLRSGAYRQKIAEALLDAIHGYQKSLKGAAVVTQQ